MTAPRMVLPGKVLMITRRCTQGQFLLRPDDDTNNAFAYCLAEAAQRFEIDVLIATAESNHHHLPILDRHGNYPAFMQHFHSMLARCLNARWGRWENLWSVYEPAATELLDLDTIIAKVVYTAANPVKDGLVERAHQWPGLNGYKALLRRTPIRARRPRHFFSPTGSMPETLELHCRIPPELGSEDEIIARVRAGVEEIEREQREYRKRTGARVLGVRAIHAQSWRDCAPSSLPRRGLRPRFAGRPVVLGPTLLAYKTFQAAYRDARTRWQGGDENVTFPPGTYRLARLAPVRLSGA